MDKYYVYSHVRKDDFQPFYVGKGSGKRCYSLNARNEYWHRVANKHGYAVKILASNLDEELAFFVEAECIDLYKKLNYSLTNMTDGGEGASGYKHSDEHKNSLKGNTFGSSTWGKNFKGKTHSAEQKAKWSVSRKGSPGTRNGVKLSEEIKAKMSASKMGKPVLARRILLDDQVREIRILLQTKKIAAIARMFSVGESTIRRIRDGERYVEVK